MSNWSGGLVGVSRLRRWRCGPGPCWRAGDGLANKDVAVLAGCSVPSVTKWRSRFVEARLDGLVDDRRPGRPATITAEQVEDVVVATIGRIWKTFGLKPHLTDGFKLSNDPLFVEKVYDIVGLYLDPPEIAGRAQC